MPININCQGFSQSLSTLNGPKKLDISYTKLLLAALTCGYDGFFKNFQGNWFNRILAVGGNVLPYIKKLPGGNLGLDEYYFSTDNSENTQGAYYIGQGLTKIFAQEYLTAPLVLHAAGCQCTKATGLAIKAPSKAIGRNMPDLFAFGDAGWHVLESKGRTVSDGSGILSASKLNSAVNDALLQVSAVNLINGTSPISRTACVWSLCTSGISGHIQDPAGDGWNASVSDTEALRSNYALFLEASQEKFMESNRFPGYSLLKIEVMNEKPFLIGIQSNLLSSLRYKEVTLRGALSFASAASKGRRDDTEYMKDGTVICISAEL